MSWWAERPTMVVVRSAAPTLPNRRGRCGANRRRHLWKQLQRAGVVVLGSSADDAAHTKFAAKYKLPFPPRIGQSGS
jgi:hypothetical protein